MAPIPENQTTISPLNSQLISVLGFSSCIIDAHPSFAPYDTPFPPCFLTRRRVIHTPNPRKSAQSACKSAVSLSVQIFSSRYSSGCLVSQKLQRQRFWIPWSLPGRWYCGSKQVAFRDIDACNCLCCFPEVIPHAFTMGCGRALRQIRIEHFIWQPSPKSFFSRLMTVRSPCRMEGCPLVIH